MGVAKQEWTARQHRLYIRNDPVPLLCMEANWEPRTEVLNETVDLLSVLYGAEVPSQTANLPFSQNCRLTRKGCCGLSARSLKTRSVSSFT